MLMGMRPKDIFMALKTENPTEELMRRFEISSEEQVINSIKRVVPQGYKDILRQLDKKNKRLRKRANSTSEDAMSVHSDEKIEEVFDVEVSTVNRVDETMTFEPFEGFEEEEESEAMQSAETRAKELEQLQLDEQKLSDMVCALEKEHVDFVSRRGKILEGLEQSNKTLKKLRDALQQEQKKATALCREYEELETKMQDNTRECAAHKELLDDIRNRITELKKINIWVYEDGTIDVENGELITISDEIVDTYFATMYRLPEANELMVKELITVAKLVCMKKEYEKMGCRYEFYFGNPKAQLLYEAVSSHDIG